jgi:hypothetical protein
MKIIYLSLLVPMAICSYNCSGSKKVSKENSALKTESTINNNSDKKLFRFTISFISKGAGIDFQIRQKYDTFLSDFETRNNIKIAVNKASWGREGEVDYCFDLSALNTEITNKFISESKALLKASDRINMGENTTCRGIIK